MTAPATRATATQAASQAARFALVDRRAHLGWQVERVDHVLDPDRHAMKRTPPWPAVERARLGEGMIGVDGGPSLDGVFAHLDALEAIARHRFGGELARRNASRDFCG
jgi:hypothetical protein